MARRSSAVPTLLVLLPAASARDWRRDGDPLTAASLDAFDSVRAAPPPPPVKPAFDMSSMVGAEYTPWRAGNQLWWHNYSQYRADVQRETKAMSSVLGFTTVRVFLHDMLWDDDAAALKKNMADFLDILEASDMKAGFVFFDDCWTHSGANLQEVCNDNLALPMQGCHNCCWVAGPQDAKRTDVNVFKDYVSGLVAEFAKDARVAWWEIFNEPQRGNKFSMSLRDAGFKWAKAESPAAPVISCWDDNNDTEVVDTHEYSVPNDRSPALSNPAKGGVITEAGCRWFQGTHDYGGPMAYVHWLTKARDHNGSSAPFAPGAMLSWEVMVGHSGTRWQWASKHGDPEPAIPWCGTLYPDGTPVSYTEAAALRRYTKGQDDFIFLGEWMDTSDRYLTVLPAAPWAGWAPAAPPQAALYELSVWPDAVQGNIAITAGGYKITLDAVPLKWSCHATEHTGCYPDARARTLPTAVYPQFGGMTWEVCGALCKDAGFGPEDYNGVEYANQCWCGKMRDGVAKLNDTDCSMPCAGDPQEAGGGPYKITVFKSACVPNPNQDVTLRAAEAAAGGKGLASLSVKSRLVSGAWNIVRVLSEPSRVRVWLNPNFADITGASVPPADLVSAPHAPAPLVDAKADAAHTAPVGLSVTSVGGPWRVDYASVLPPTLFSE